MSKVKPVARYLLPGPTFKGISPSFGQVRSYDEYSEEHVKETKGYWLEGEKLYREADYAALQQRLAEAEELLRLVDVMPSGITAELKPGWWSRRNDFLDSPGCADGEKN